MKQSKRIIAFMITSATIDLAPYGKLKLACEWFQEGKLNPREFTELLHDMFSDDGIEDWQEDMPSLRLLAQDIAR